MSKVKSFLKNSINLTKVNNVGQIIFVYWVLIQSSQIKPKNKEKIKIEVILTTLTTRKNITLPLSFLR